MLLIRYSQVTLNFFQDQVHILVLAGKSQVKCELYEEKILSRISDNDLDFISMLYRCLMTELYFVWTVICLYVSGRFLFLILAFQLLSNGIRCLYQPCSRLISIFRVTSQVLGRSLDRCLPLALFVSTLLSADICNRRRLQLGKVLTHILFPLWSPQ